MMLRDLVAAHTTCSVGDVRHHQRRNLFFACLSVLAALAVTVVSAAMTPP